MAQVGDIVRYIDSVGGGRIVKIEGQLAYVDEDGFETPVLLRECVVVTPAAKTAGTSRPSQSKYATPAKAVADTKAAKKPAVTDEPMTVATVVADLPDAPKPGEIEETAKGDKLNVVLAYEPEEIKHLNTTEYDAYLVNDSNYYLYFTYLTRADGHQWVTRYAGVVEPNIQVHLGHITRDDLPAMDRVAVQYVAFKRDKEFLLKAPVAVESVLDTTKFFKLHCYRDNMYFDTPVIAVDIVKNDIPQRAMVIDSSRLEEAIKARKATDMPHRHAVERKSDRMPDIVEVDLHIGQLLDNTSGLSNADMLRVQLDEFNRVMKENLRHPGRKIVFIHGKGEGVLRSVLLKELRRHYPKCEVQDASFREYGFGATQVTIH